MNLKRIITNSIINLRCTEHLSIFELIVLVFQLQLFCFGSLSLLSIKKKMLKWVTTYDIVNIPGWTAQVKYMCGKHC